MKYQSRRLKNKGAILLLVGNFLVTFVSKVVIIEVLKTIQGNLVTAPVVRIIGMRLPIAGWLADICLGSTNWNAGVSGQYWLAVMYWPLAIYVAVISFESYHVIDTLMIALTIIIIMVHNPFWWFQANIIHFRVDQLTDSTTNLHSLVYLEYNEE